MDAQFIDDSPRSQTSTKLIIGLFLAVLGILLTADNLNLLDADRYLRLWPLVLVAAGVVKIVEPGTAIVGIILMLAGASLLAVNLGLLRFSILDLWPLILIVIGMIMVAGAMGITPRDAVPGNVAIFSSQTISESSADYRGGRLTAVLGGHELDLRNADIATSPAVLHIFTMWGGIEIRVPENWDVVSEALPIMGGIEIKTTPAAADPRKQLIIRGLVLMGGVEVRSHSRRAR
jgi:predicted membrane protein